MIEFVCEFIVRDEFQGQFELAYGPGGAWSKLFADAPGFRGTSLLRDTKDPRRYLMVDIWDSGVQRKQLLAEREAEYAKLDSAFADWTESQTEIGVFQVRADATVRRRGKPQRGRMGQAGKISRQTYR
jgi:heme-degrading monooxygenase HmoA